MSDIPGHNHLAHLMKCPDCVGNPTRPEQYMTHVFMSQGRNHPDTQGAWGRKLIENDNNVERASSASENRLFSRQAAKTILIQWWSLNNAEPDTMDVQAPHHPHFHPAHSQDLVSLYAADTTPFESFNPTLNIWKLCSINTPPQIVERNIVLQFRSRGVQCGIGMPQGSILRLGQNNQIEVPPTTSSTQDLRPRFTEGDYYRPTIPALSFSTPTSSGTPSSPASQETFSPLDSPTPVRADGPSIDMDTLLSFDPAPTVDSALTFTPPSTPSIVASTSTGPADCEA
ncbi:hypothetical protein C8R46DRAFT_1221700 [Mycena filopes]|nr:hypothetical protein C8R46DRAFT_1221700 [Mycena filopes]